MTHTDGLKKESKELIEKARQSNVFLPEKSKRRMSEEDMQICDLITMYLPVMGEGEVARTISKALGKVVSITRVKHLRMRMEANARANFKNLTSFEVAVESRETYLRLEREGWRLIHESEIMGGEEGLNLRLKGMEFLRKSRESLDRLYKLTGLLKEEIYIHHGDPTKTPQWRQFEQAIMLWIRLELKQDPQKFINFIAKISEDPNAIDEYISYGAKRRVGLKDRTWNPTGKSHANWSEAEDVIDVEEEESESEEKEADESPEN